MASGTTTQPGQRGSGAGGRLPRRRGLVETATREDYLPRPVRVRVVPSQIANDRISLSLSQSKFLFPPKVSCPAGSIVSRPFIIFGSLPLVFLLLFCYAVETPWRR